VQCLEFFSPNVTERSARDGFLSALKSYNAAMEAI
jgi:hypothetical protein